MKTGCGGGHLCILALPGCRAEASGCVAPFDPDHSPSMGVCCRLAPGEGAGLPEDRGCAAPVWGGLG